MASAVPHGRPWQRTRTRAVSRRQPRRERRRVPDLPFLLAFIPSLPRSTLSRLTTAMIDRMDQLDPDPDLEDGHDWEYVDDV